MRYNLKSVKIVLFCTTNTTTNANEIKALTRVESEILPKNGNDYADTKFIGEFKNKCFL